MQTKLINGNLISYKTSIRTYNEITPDNRETLIRRNEVIITGVKTTQKNILLPDEIDGYCVSDIGHSVFEGNEEIEHVTLPNQLIYIREKAFKNCVNLKIVDFPKSLRIIEEDSFSECTALKEVNLLNDSTIILHRAFKGCKQLSKINMPGSLCYICKSVFDDTAFLNDESNWDDGVLYAGSCLITAQGIKNSYKVREGTTTIASFAFQDNIAMTEIILPDSVKDIGYLAFDGCESLNRITGPKGIFDYEIPLFHDSIDI